MRSLRLRYILRFYLHVDVDSSARVVFRMRRVIPSVSHAGITVGIILRKIRWKIRWRGRRRRRWRCRFLSLGGRGGSIFSTVNIQGSVPLAFE
jgi:hypothetical protein